MAQVAGGGGGRKAGLSGDSKMPKMKSSSTNVNTGKAPKTVTKTVTMKRKS